MLLRNIDATSCGRRALLVAAIAALCSATPPAFAATRHVAAGAGDAGDCIAAPCGSLGYAYSQSASGDVVQVGAGSYSEQEVPGGSKAVTFRGVPGARMIELDNSADNVTFDGIEVDSQFTKPLAGFENHGSDNVTFKNGRIGNVTDEKGALVSGSNFTFDNVLFHDIVLRTDGVHLECVYAIGVPGMTVRNSTFRDCAVMDIFFTYGSWWSPLPPAYGNITLENNVFEHSEMENAGGWHYYSLYVADNGPNGRRVLDGWTVRNNTFENSAFLADSGINGARWVGNLGDWDCSSGVSFSHNVGKQCGSTDTAVSPANSCGPPACASLVTAPFGLVDPPNHDFHLKSSSVAIGKADPTDHPTLDHDGLERDAQPDAGAHEYGAKPPGGTQGFVPTGGGKRRLVRSARLRARVICRRPTRRCPKATSVRISVAEPARVVMRLQRLRKGRKARTVRSVRRKVTTSAALRIRARGLRRGRYRAVLVATNGAGAKSTPRIFKLRVR